MKIMVTGDQGYIGSVLVPTLLEKGYDVVGFDSGYFSGNLLMDYRDSYPKITKDLRDLTIVDLDGVEGIIHLAGLSNDPLGEFSPKLTQFLEQQPPFASFHEVLKQNDGQDPYVLYPM